MISLSNDNVTGFLPFSQRVRFATKFDGKEITDNEPTSETNKFATY